MKAIIEDIARQLVILNASWLSEVRTVGYRATTEKGVVITDFENEIGITDRDGNSGYIRFAADTNFTRQESRALTSCVPSSRYTFKLRLVVIAKTETPEDLALLLSTQINALQLTYTNINNIKCSVTSGGSNSAAITRNEGGEQINSTYRTVFVDFDLMFDWINDCDQIQIIMNCDNCTTTLDLGCIQHCETITVHADIAYTGTATLNTFFNGITVTQSFEVTEGEDMEVPLSGLNENYEYSIQFRDVNGEVIPVFGGEHEQGHNEGEHVGEEYDCIKITLVP